MNILNAKPGVFVRVRQDLVTKSSAVPLASPEHLSQREIHAGQSGCITVGADKDGHTVWVLHEDGYEAPYWYHELDELPKAEVEKLIYGQAAENTGWEGKPLGDCQKAGAEGVIQDEREDKMSDIHITDFVRRQTPDSRFSHWLLTDDELLDRVQEAFDIRKTGYRDGVVLVPVDPEGFFTGVVTLQEGDKLKGAFVSRQKGESPRKAMTLDSGKGDVASRKPPAVSVEIVLYRDNVLAEDGEGTGHEWNIVSVNANPVEGSVPMNPATMMANHFHDDGGTQTGMTDEEFVKALSDSYFFWNDKAFIG